MRYQITHVHKPDRFSPVERITHVLVPLFSPVPVTVAQIVEAIEAGHSFYVARGLLGQVDVEVAHRGIAAPPFIKTRPDTTLQDNLLSLPECTI